MISSLLIQAIMQQYRLSLEGLHGPRHWARVFENGRALAKHTGAKVEVVELFAVFHDACRINDHWDQGHGSRGADLATVFRGKYFELSDSDFAALKLACRLHTDGLTEGDVTVITCWDADRLDLGRVGMKPYKDLLCTDAARSFEIYDWANERACNRIVPKFVHAEWLNSTSSIR